MFKYTTANGLIIESKQELERGDVIVIRKDGITAKQFMQVEHISKDNIIELEPYNLKTVSLKFKEEDIA